MFCYENICLENSNHLNCGNGLTQSQINQIILPIVLDFLLPPKYWHNFLSESPLRQTALKMKWIFFPLFSNWKKIGIQKHAGKVRKKNVMHSATNIGCKFEDFQKNFLSYFTPTVSKKVSEKKCRGKDTSIFYLKLRVMFREYRISEWAGFQVWKFLHPQG